MIFCHTASDVAPVTMLVAEIAPGFTSGFISGAPVPDDRPDAFNRDDRVEPRAGGIDADAFLDRAGALLLDDLGHREDLGDRLDRHLGLHVAGGVDLAVRRDQGDAEQVRIDLGERRNVVGVLAFVEGPELSRTRRRPPAGSRLATVRLTVSPARAPRDRAGTPGQRNAEHVYSLLSSTVPWSAGSSDDRL